jgi:hypothetical protein
LKIMTNLLPAAAAILLCAQPVSAADLGDDSGGASAATQRHGAFAGARLRVPLGGTDREVRAGLAAAPLVQNRGADGSLQTRFGDGVEFGFAGRKPAGLSLGGTRLSDLGQRRDGPGGTRLGTSTGKGLAIVGGIVLLTLGGVALLLMAQE